MRITKSGTERAKLCSAAEPPRPRQDDFGMLNFAGTERARISCNGETEHASPKHSRVAMAGFMEFYDLRWRLEGIRDVSQRMRTTEERADAEGKRENNS